MKKLSYCGMCPVQHGKLFLRCHKLPAEERVMPQLRGIHYIPDSLEVLGRQGSFWQRNDLWILHHGVCSIKSVLL